MSEGILVILLFVMQHSQTPENMQERLSLLSSSINLTIVSSKMVYLFIYLYLPIKLILQTY